MLFVLVLSGSAQWSDWPPTDQAEDDHTNRNCGASNSFESLQIHIYICVQKGVPDTQTVKWLVTDHCVITVIVNHSAQLWVLDEPDLGLTLVTAVTH